MTSDDWFIVYSVTHALAWTQLNEPERNSWKIQIAVLPTETVINTLFDAHRQQHHSSASHRVFLLSNCAIFTPSKQEHALSTFALFVRDTTHTRINWAKIELLLNGDAFNVGRIHIRGPGMEWIYLWKQVDSVCFFFCGRALSKYRTRRLGPQKNCAANSAISNWLMIRCALLQ